MIGGATAPDAGPFGVGIDAAAAAKLDGATGTTIVRASSLRALSKRPARSGTSARQPLLPPRPRQHERCDHWMARSASEDGGNSPSSSSGGSVSDAASGNADVPFAHSDQHQCAGHGARRDCTNHARITIQLHRESQSLGDPPQPLGSRERDQYDAGGEKESRIAASNACSCSWRSIRSREGGSSDSAHSGSTMRGRTKPITAGPSCGR